MHWVEVTRWLFQRNDLFADALFPRPTAKDLWKGLWSLSWSVLTAPGPHRRRQHRPQEGEQGSKSSNLTFSFLGEKVLKYKCIRRLKYDSYPELSSFTSRNQGSYGAALSRGTGQKTIVIERPETRLPSGAA